MARQSLRRGLPFFAILVWYYMSSTFILFLYPAWTFSSFVSFAISFVSVSFPPGPVLVRVSSILFSKPLLVAQALPRVLSFNEQK